MVLLLSALFFGWYIFALIVGLVGVFILVISFSHVLARTTIPSPHSTQESRETRGYTSLIAYVAHPLTLAGIIWMGVYLLLVSVYASWVAPTVMVVLILSTMVMIVSVVLLLSHQQGWYRLSRSHTDNVLFVSLFHWFGSLLLHAVFTLGAIFSGDWLSLEVMGIAAILMFSGIFLISSRWYTLLSEQWMSLSLLVLLVTIGWYSLVLSGVFWYFAALFVALMTSIGCLYLPTVSWMPDRLSSTFREIGFYFACLVLVGSFVGVLLFDALFWHILMLSVGAWGVVVFLFVEFRLLFTWWIVTIASVMIGVSLLLQSHLVGRDLSFALLVIVSSLYGALSLPLKPQWSANERGVLSLVILGSYLAASLLFAIERQGFQLIGFAWLFLTFGILLLITFRDIRTYFGMYDFSKVSLLIRSRSSR